MLVVAMLAVSTITAVTPLGQQMQALAVTIAGDVVCSQCVGINGDGTNDIKDASVTSATLATSAVTKSKLAANSVDGGKISDGTISAADLGPDSVGASEIKGITKLMFAQCTPSFSSIAAGQVVLVSCNVPGVDSDDFVLTTNNHQFLLF